MRLAPLALALAACARDAEDPALRLATRREVLLDIKPTAILAADLDGDGREDLVATDAERGELRVWNARDGSIAGPGHTVRVGGWPLAPVVVPTTSNGKRLVAVASRARNEVVILQLLEKSGAREIDRSPLDGTPRALAAGSLPGMAEPTVVAVACDDGILELMFPADTSERRGTIQRVSRIAFPIKDGLPRCALVLADGSGIIVGYQDRRSLLFVDPAQGRPPEREIQLDGIPRALCEADLDGDGDLELAVAGGDGSIWVLGFGEAGGSNAWKREDAPAPLVWTAGSIPIDIHASDLDGDGRKELLWLEYQSLAWNVARGFRREGPDSVARGYAGQTPCAFALLGGDLVVANRDAQAISIAAGIEGGAFASPQETAVGRFPTAVRPGDLDNDGDMDLVVLESKDETASVLISRRGTLERGAVLRTGPDPRGACLADIDGDGQLDLALVADDANGSAVRCWVGMGGLAPRPSEVGPRVGRGVRALLAVDFDGDRHADLVAADAELGQVTLLPGPALEVGDGPCALAPIRIDGDAAPEIAVALEGPGPRAGIALLDVEAGRLRETGRIETGGSVIALAVADLDGDGSHDLAALVLSEHGSQAGEARAYLRRGDGFEFASAVPVSAHPRSIAAGDLDGDGLADVVVAAQYAHRVDLALARRAADGRPWRLERQDALGAGVGSMDAVVVDMDRDGMRDVVVANGHSDDVSVIRVTRP